MTSPPSRRCPQFWQPLHARRKHRRTTRLPAAQGRQRLPHHARGHGHAPGQPQHPERLRSVRRRLRQGVDIGLQLRRTRKGILPQPGRLLVGQLLVRQQVGAARMQADRRGFQFPDVVGDGQPRQRPLCSLRFRRRRPLPPTHGPGLLRHEHRPDTLHHARQHRVPQHGRLAGYGRFAQLQPPLRRPGSWHGSRRNSPMSTNRPRSSWDATARFTRTAEAAA